MRGSVKAAYSASIRGYMVAYMCGFLVFSFALLLFVLQVLGLLPSLNDSAYRSLANHAEGNVALLSSELSNTSRNTTLAADRLSSHLERLMRDKGYSMQDMRSNPQLLDEVLGVALSGLEEHLDSTPATGAFVFLDARYTNDDYIAGVYLRDPTPGVISSEYEFMLERGPKHISDAAGMAPTSTWSYEQFWREELLFYNEPMRVAMEGERDAGYWSSPFYLAQGDKRIVTFTTPLYAIGGEPIGVIGVELSQEYIMGLISRSSLPFDEGFYLISKLDEHGAIVTASAMSGSARGREYLRHSTSRLRLRLESASPEDAPVFTAPGQDGDVYVAIHPLNLYDMPSPFAGEGYYLAAIAKKSQVLLNSRNVYLGIALCVLFSFALAVLAALALSGTFSGRVERLVAEVERVDPELPICLSPTHIREIDALSQRLTKMSGDIAMYSMRMSSIVDMVGIPMGAFEVQEENARVYFTESLFRLLCLHKEDKTNYVPIETFRSLFHDVKLPAADGASADQEINWKDREQWFRIRLKRAGKSVYGTVIDITQEVRQRHSLEYERDYDPLTKLYNRNSYPRHMGAMIERAPDEKGVLLFGDLDNLKYINDTFGHDMGDRYIQMAANALKLFERYGGAVARISGDEFAVYLHGGESRDRLRFIVDDTIAKVRDRTMLLPDENVQKVRISIGLAFYPDDATSIDRLVRYADFAMYEIKHSAKGGTREFDRESYKKNSFILNKPSHLDRLIEHKRVTFAFQPIMEVSTGRVYGYEALMRPLIREIHTPEEVLALAKSQSKLNQIERLTLIYTFDWYGRHSSFMEGKKLFINLIANQALPKAVLDSISADCPDIWKTIVMEITQSESDQESVLMDKVRLIREFGSEVALDDYGSGYNSEKTLLKVSPDYIKLDMSIVRSIHTDANRQKLTRNAVEYAHGNNIRVIAEGVESSEELSKLIELGVDMVQGYYTGKPEYTLSAIRPDIQKEAKTLYEKFRANA